MNQELQKMSTFATIEDLQRPMLAKLYIADQTLTMAEFLALKRRKPLLMEGGPSVGKSEEVKVLAAIPDTPSNRLQSFKGVYMNTALYERNHMRQMSLKRLMEAGGIDRQEELKGIFGSGFLMQFPLFEVIDPANTKYPILLIDELGRSDEEFEANLLELPSDFQVIVINPERPTITARRFHSLMLFSRSRKDKFIPACLNSD